MLFPGFESAIVWRQGGASAISDARRKVIDDEVKKIVDQSYANAKRIIKENEDKLHALARELIDKETLTGKQVRDILGVKEKEKST